MSNVWYVLGFVFGSLNLGSALVDKNWSALGGWRLCP